MRERSSRLRIGTFDSMVSLPPRCTRKVRSLTRPISTPWSARIPSTSALACSTSRAAQVRSTRTRDGPEAVTSRAVTRPPPFSTTAVSSLTAVGRAGSSRRTVIEYETLGADGMATSLGTAWRPILPHSPAPRGLTSPRAAAAGSAGFSPARPGYPAGSGSGAVGPRAGSRADLGTDAHRLGGRQPVPALHGEAGRDDDG